MMQADRPQDESWVEIDVRAFEHNIQFFRRDLDECGHKRTALGVVLKGNAYGHGLEELADLCARQQVLKIIYVFRAWEARSIVTKKAPPQRVLVLGPPPFDWGEHPDDENIEWVISSASHLAQLGALRIRKPDLELAVHIHLDTGLGREGFAAGEVEDAFRTIASHNRIQVVGVMSHFANTEDVTRQDYALKQLKVFHSAADRLESVIKELGRVRLERHIAASAASLVLLESHCDVVRLGIGVYGLWPSSETRLSYVMGERHKGDRERKADTEASLLHPVLSWRVRSQCVKSLDRGDFVGYGCTFRCSRPTRVAVFPVGYADGYARCLTGHAHVLVDGARCPIIGRVMMNHIVVALADEVRLPQDEPAVVATLLGRDGGEVITAEDLAQWSGTINYEVTTRLRESLPRILR